MILDVPPGGTLRVGDRVKVQHYTVIAAAHDLTIGDDTQIAEHCSIRDSDHGLEGGATIASQTISSKTHLGSDVWIGRGAAVLRGSQLGDGAVLGANAVLKGTLAAGEVAVGNPARVVSRRR